MTGKEVRILAINPGSRYVGIAIFRGQELIEWAVRSSRPAAENLRVKNLGSFLEYIVQRHGIDRLVLKGLHHARSSRELDLLVAKIREWASERDIPVHEFSINEIEASLLSEERGNKRALMETVAAYYPFLYPELDEEKRNKNPYRVRMFEAVALGMTFAARSENMKGRKTDKTTHEKD